MASGDSGRGFPEDLAREILLRLPVKSLLRFKCCCKNWYALIKNPTFINQHLYCSNKNKEPHLLIYDFDAQDPMVTLIDSHGAAVQDPVNYFQSFRGMSQVVGPVDGLFLLESSPTDGMDISVALWNPATREMRDLPAAQFNGIHTSLKHFGFGLDPFTNDYKVVCFQTFHEDHTHITKEYSVYAAVYSCSMDSWKIFNPNNYKVATNRIRAYRGIDEAYGTAYLNGSYYWLLHPNIHDSTCNILSFNFSKEVFEEFEGPEGYFFKLVLFDDAVALLEQVEGCVYIIWVMIQPGVWNKLLTCEYISYFKSWYSSTAIFVSRYCRRLISYNVRTKELRRLGFPHRNLTEPHTLVYCYKESLVSIRRGGNGELNHSLQLTRND